MKKKSQNRQPESSDGLVRLQKLLALHGHGSRRKCEEFILEGRCEVDGKVVNKLGTKVDPEKQKVVFDGERIVQRRLQYFMLNKPPGVLSTASDPSGRIRVIDLVKTNSRVYNVGRLDKSSEGLILVTNDGDLANQLTHPRYGVEKKYDVLVAGRPDREQLEKLKKGFFLAEAFVQVSNVRAKKRMKDSTLLEIVLDEGRNREIRRILARIGHKVTQLRRIAIGPLQLGDLPLGAHRQLSVAEVNRLKKAAVEVKPGQRKKKPRSTVATGSRKRQAIRKKSTATPNRKKTGRPAAANKRKNKRRG